MLSSRIPFTVIGGFLGAGKTTLLNHLLRSRPGYRVALMINDFGALNIDASLIESTDGETIALTNGCVCCSIGDDLSAALIRVLDAKPPFEAVVVEASGVSDPGRIARLGKAASELQLDSVIVVVDASSVLGQLQDHQLVDTLVAQIRSADLLVLNKVDLVSQDALSAISIQLLRHAPNTPFVQTTQGALAWQLITSPDVHALAVEKCSCCETLHHHHANDSTHHETAFEAWSESPRVALSTATWRARLEALPRSVLRLKGYVASLEHGLSEVQLVGGRLNIRPASGPRTSTEAVLVAIGVRGQLPRRQLDAVCE